MAVDLLLGCMAGFVAQLLAVFVGQSSTRDIAQYLRHVTGMLAQVLLG